MNSNTGFYPDYGFVLHKMDPKKGAKFFFNELAVDYLCRMDAKTIIGTSYLSSGGQIYAFTIQFPPRWFKYIRSYIESIEKGMFAKFLGNNQSIFECNNVLLEERAIRLKSITVTLAKMEISSLTGERFIPANVISEPVSLGGWSES